MTEFTKLSSVRDLYDLRSLELVGSMGDLSIKSKIKSFNPFESLNVQCFVLMSNT